MREWEAYDKGAKRLAEQYAPDDEDVLQEARLGMLEGMMDVYKSEKEDGPMSVQAQDWVVRTEIEAHIFGLINADKTYEVNNPEDLPKDRDRNHLALVNAVSPTPPPDVIYEENLFTNRVRDAVRELPSMEMRFLMFSFWEPERFTGWLEEDKEGATVEGIRANAHHLMRNRLSMEDLPCQ